MTRVSDLVHVAPSSPVSNAYATSVLVLSAETITFTTDDDALASAPSVAPPSVVVVEVVVVELLPEASPPVTAAAPPSDVVVEVVVVELLEPSPPAPAAAPSAPSVEVVVVVVVVELLEPSPEASAPASFPAAPPSATAACFLMAVLANRNPP